MTYSLDRLDKEILEILQEDGRISYSKIAQMLNMSESTIHMRIKRLRELGILRGFYADIDMEKIGLKVLAFVQLKADPKKYEQVLNVLKEMKEVAEIYDVTGEYYALVKVVVPSNEDLAKVLDDIGKLDGVTDTYTMIVLRVIKEGKKVNLDLV
ncbi:MAG: Lrp/AsnC family transcriptional regulator [Sulfolobaceae archaeon]|jgi:Lrp/AsnC family transcriptional regulator for asnA, asnC and gidA|nr:Lrp/AsnC family transcriptional regulator [Sulfolobales archaeon]MCG2908429.1 Lrp/AsnC family transcriptional regulator [Sulfolobales archaeon]MCQ4335167.1 Lrp/AsnC family transcriptional regulator [Sulfolobales archaeon]MCQ4336853.1 Lrp/AsnC family transcriptional regulator [Sulfolobales archaeon]MCQ4337056.1 Lrp/AsnC family transcriptional regulator [Sulfolobales archaeon]